MEFRNYEEFKTAIKSCGIPSSEAEFKKATVQTPYLLFFRANEIKLYADGAPVITVTKMAAELYTEKSDLVSEPLLENWFRSQGINATKSDRAFITSENFYETVYEFELIFGE